MEKLYILDASGYIYRSYFAIKNMTNAKGDSTNALFGFIRSVLKLFKDFGPKHFVSVFDGPNNGKLRKELYPEYKAHRSAMPEDLLYQINWAENFCELMGIPNLKVPGVEADDTMGCIAKWAAELNATVYLCTSDKDMCQLVNDKILILNTHKDNLILGEKEILENYGVNPNQIVDWLSITGDASDNIPGLPGFGPKTASSLLQQYGTLDYILDHPEAFSGKKQETIVQKRDDAILSRKLVMLNMQVEFPKNPEFFELKKPDVENLKTFYSSMNFSSLLKELEAEYEEQNVEQKLTEEFYYTLVDDENALNELVNYLFTQKEICFDTETTSLKVLEAELVGIGFATEQKKAWYVPANGNLGMEKVLQTLKPLFETPSIGFYGHNVKYDYHILFNHGIKIATICFDTLLASYLLNSHTRAHSLDSLTYEYFKKVKIPTTDLIGKGKNQITMKDVDIQKVSDYCCEDVDYTCRLKALLEPELGERKLTKLFLNLELPLVKVLSQMERKGIYVDVECLKKQGVIVNDHIKVLTEDIFQMAGAEFNLNSPKQLSEILFTKLQIKPPKKTATGLSTNVEVLETLQKDYPIASKILEYRSLEKLRSTYIESLPLEINPKTHRIHCTFNQLGAATGRLSCQDPNLQNIPIRSAMGRQIREAFCPEKSGWSYLGADYSQIELRLLAHLSEDEEMIRAFQNNEDIHARTASLIFNIPITEVTKELRYHAKAVNFGIVYGQQAYGLSQELQISVKEASEFIEMYFKKYVRVKEYMEACKEKARKTGKTVTITGRERLIPEINSKNGMLRSAAERLAINTPLQGTAADLIKMAMLSINKELQEKSHLGSMILQIHDELIFEIPDFEIMSVEPLVKKSMENVLKLKVPLIVDIAIGKNWKEC
jgi:DNA polymerase-1